MDFEVLWLVGIGLGRPTTYQKIRSGDEGGPKLWTRTCAKNAFSHMTMQKVGSARMAKISRFFLEKNGSPKNTSLGARNQSVPVQH